jgi:hypothetical protein
VLARATGTVESVTSERSDVQEIMVKVGEGLRKAVVYPALTGRAEPGQTVLLNTWAVEMGLGTGGVDFVMAVLADSETHLDPEGHILKLRYTPLQHPVLAAAAPESPYHEAFQDFCSLDGIPVVCAELHSQIPAIAAAAKWETKGAARVVYIMTDGAALPLAFSHIVPELKQRGLIDATITAGQAFGGDYEAVNLYSALAAATTIAKADVVIVSQGPGNTGTNTLLGFSGVEQGVAINAAASMDGTPIAVVRISFADPRPRHYGISHHTRTVLERVTLVPALVPLPRLSGEERDHLKAVLEEGELLERHEFITVDAEVGLQALIDCGMNVTTMGRGLEEERAFFLSAAAAGLLAGQWMTGDMDTSAPL